MISVLPIKTTTETVVQHSNNYYVNSIYSRTSSERPPLGTCGRWSLIRGDKCMGHVHICD